MQGSSETIALGGGCFWCTEAVFKELDGILSVEPGYAGGNVENPSYRQVCSGNTGHAEVVKLVFDPETISVKDILEVFFATHDPTSVNRQGADVGTQYRSIILYSNIKQKEAAESLMNEISSETIFSKPIVTELKELGAFYSAEDYHRDYFESNPFEPYCQFVISPKLQKFRKKFKENLKLKN